MFLCQQELHERDELKVTREMAVQTGGAVSGSVGLRLVAAVAAVGAASVLLADHPSAAHGDSHVASLGHVAARPFAGDVHTAGMYLHPPQGIGMQFGFEAGAGSPVGYRHFALAGGEGLDMDAAEGGDADARGGASLTGWTFERLDADAPGAAAPELDADAPKDAVSMVNDDPTERLSEHAAKTSDDVALVVPWSSDIAESFFPFADDGVLSETYASGDDFQPLSVFVEDPSPDPRATLLATAGVLWCCMWLVHFAQLCEAGGGAAPGGAPPSTPARCAEREGGVPREGAEVPPAAISADPEVQPVLPRRRLRIKMDGGLPLAERNGRQEPPKGQFHWDEGITCSVCGGGDALDGNDLGLCDGCNGAWHQKCHRPAVASFGPLHQKWFCAGCSGPGKRKRPARWQAGSLAKKSRA